MKTKMFLTVVVVVAGVSVTLSHAGAGAAAIEEKTEKKGHYIKVEVKGLLQDEVAAIGGETTGTEITANGITWELDFGKKADFKRKAKALNGKTALVKGSLKLKKGVERPRRWIVTVTSLETGKKK